VEIGFINNLDGQKRRMSPRDSQVYSEIRKRWRSRDNQDGVCDQPNTKEGSVGEKASIFSMILKWWAERTG